jgi:ADP-ribosyl-[dinitrogen reductase] hydrolase
MHSSMAFSRKTHVSYAFGSLSRLPAGPGLRRCRRYNRRVHASWHIHSTLVLAQAISNALRGEPKDDVLRLSSAGLSAPKVIAIAHGEYRSKSTTEITGTGYAVASLEAALWCFHHTDSFAEAVLGAANLGDDADTTAAIVGQLAGAYYGAQAIPADWTNKLWLQDEIEGIADALLSASAHPGQAPAL